MAAPDYSGVEQGIAKGYNAQRQQAASTEAGNLQGQKDALARRAAALGNAPGGAFVKAEQQTGNDSAQRLQQANAGIDAAQNAELRGVKMTQLGQQFTTSERQGSEAHADTAQAATFAHEDTSQGTGIQAAKEQQATGIASQEKMAAAQIEAQKTMQDKGITAQSTLQDRQLAAQEVMQKTGIDAQAAMQMVGITAQKDMQDTQQKFQADQAQKDRDIKVDEFMKQMDAQWAQINGYSIDPANRRSGQDT